MRVFIMRYNFNEDKLEFIREDTNTPHQATDNQQQPKEAKQ